VGAVGNAGAFSKLLWAAAVWPSTGAAASTAPHQLRAGALALPSSPAFRFCFSR